MTTRFELLQPGPMLPPVPAAVLGVAGDDRVKDDLTIVWTFVLCDKPPQVGVSVAIHSAISGQEQVALELLRKHREFTLSVPDASWARSFDIIDMGAAERTDKFSRAGLTRLPSKLVGAPGIAEAPIVLECRVTASHPLPPERTIFVADVLRTTVMPGVADEKGRLIADSRPFFGMMAGSGEFWTFAKKIGHIGMTLTRDDIRY